MIKLKLMMFISVLANISALQGPMVALDSPCPVCQQREESALTALQDIEKSIRQLHLATGIAGSIAA